MKYLNYTLKFILVLLVLLVAFVYYDFQQDIHNRDRWPQSPLQSIVFKGDLWQPLDIRLPTEVDNQQYWIKYNSPIPHLYQLTRKNYQINIEVNPPRRNVYIGPISLQILATRTSDDKALRVEISWQGNCARVGKISKTGKWDTYQERYDDMTDFYFTDPSAVGFLWGRGSGGCRKDTPEAMQQASSFPISLKIYDGSILLGEAQIDFEIFENGISKFRGMS
jgi:GTPase SAR1 family protein